MGWITNLRFRLKAVFSPRQMEQELDEEMAFHLEMEVKKLMREGMSPDRARFDALRHFGDPLRQKEMARDSWGVRWIQDLRSDTGFTLRTLGRRPGFALVAVLTLALGIGGTTAIFSVVNGVVLKPLPYRDSEGLVALSHTMPGIDVPKAPLGPALYRTYREHARSLQAIGLWRSVVRTVTGLGEPERVATLEVTGGLLDLLGVSPLLGRGYSPEDEEPGTTAPVILSSGYWQSRFGGDPDVLKRTIRIEGVESPIIGVLPPNARIEDQDPDILVPIRLNPLQGVGNWNYGAIARLSPGFTPTQVTAELSGLTPLACELYPGIPLEELQRRGFGTVATPLKAEVLGDTGKVLWVVFGTVAVVLLLACANVANLFLLKADGQVRDVALRRALGASRGRLVRQNLTESLLLGLVGGLVGVGLAYGGLRLLLRSAPPSLPRLDEVGLDATTFLFCLGLTLSVGIVFGSLPELRGEGASLAEPLKEGGRGAGRSRARNRARNVLAVIQIALALVLLAGSGLMIRTFLALKSVPPGYERPEEVLTFRLSISGAEASTGDEAARMHQEILGRLAALPGVTTVGAAYSVAMEGWEPVENFVVEGFPVAAGDPNPLRVLNWVTPDFFHTLQTPLLAGHSFDWADALEHRHVAIVSETFAREFWSTPQQALGKRFRMDNSDEWKEIVGVAGDIRTRGVTEEPPALIYFPLVMEGLWGPKESVYTERNLRYALRTARHRATDILPEVRQAVGAVNPRLPLSDVRTLDDIFAASISRTSFTLVMLGIAAGVAVVLGVVGVYGVVSYLVAQRRREMGIRMAMGATTGQVGTMVLREGGSLAGMGILAGAVTAAGLTRLLSTLLFGVSPLDPLTFGVVTVTLLAVVLLASFVPARRAAAVDPTEALRAD
jgi:putative ABC transport system permease protein